MIRRASKFDLPMIVDLFLDFHTQGKTILTKDASKWSSDYFELQLTKTLAGLGFVLIDGDGKGVLWAIKAPCLFIPDVYALFEVMWHSKDKKTSLALLKEYLIIGQEMKTRGQVDEVHFSSFSDTGFEKMGARKFTTDWVL